MIKNLCQNIEIPNTFGIKSIASHWVDFCNDEMLIEDLPEIYNFANTNNLPIKIIGSASNIILPMQLNALVLHPINNEISFLDIKSEDFTYVKVAAGVPWHSFVKSTLERGVFGLENLALIPGLVGASVVQNIGAYGCEVCQFVESVEAVSLKTLERRIFSNRECNFSYRSSIFKQDNSWLVLNINFKLLKKARINISYSSINNFIEKNATAYDIFDFVVGLRKQKLPNPSILGSVGSFFINPVIDKNLLNKVLRVLPKISYWDLGNGTYKLAAGSLIDALGWRGYVSSAGVGVYASQALVLVNFGCASAKDIISLAQAIMKDISLKTGVILEIEPNCWI